MAGLYLVGIIALNALSASAEQTVTVDWSNCKCCDKCDTKTTDDLSKVTECVSLVPKDCVVDVSATITDDVDGEAACLPDNAELGFDLSAVPAGFVLNKISADGLKADKCGKTFTTVSQDSVCGGSAVTTGAPSDGTTADPSGTTIIPLTTAGGDNTTAPAAGGDTTAQAPADDTTGPAARRLGDDDADDATNAALDGTTFSWETPFPLEGKGVLLTSAEEDCKLNGATAVTATLGFQASPKPDFSAKMEWACPNDCCKVCADKDGKLPVDESAIALARACVKKADKSCVVAVHGTAQLDVSKVCVDGNTLSLDVAEELSGFIPSTLTLEGLKPTGCAPVGTITESAQPLCSAESRMLGALEFQETKPALTMDGDDGKFTGMDAITKNLAVEFADEAALTASKKSQCVLTQPKDFSVEIAFSQSGETSFAPTSLRATVLQAVGALALVSLLF